MSRLPGRNDLLVKTFPRGDRWYLVAYCFEGRNAHQTLGMLLTKRMERSGIAGWVSLIVAAAALLLLSIRIMVWSGALIVGLF